MRVVLVEDDHTMQKELARAVKRMFGGEVVMTSESARPAIEWLEEHPQGWDLAIVDMFLKEGHGFDVLRHCRKALPHQRAVMLSNYGRDHVASYANAAGADRFFDKSFDLDELVDYCKTLSDSIARETHVKRPMKSAPMRLKFNIDLAYEARGKGADFVFNIEAAETPQQSVVAENLILPKGCESVRHVDPATRSRFLRILAPAGSVAVTYVATVDIDQHLENPAAIDEYSIGKIPGEVLPYIFPSRYCQSDRLLRLAYDLFGKLPIGYARAQAICDWVSDNVTFASNTTSGETSACDTILQRQGVCRDFAHLMIALCRALNMPARFVTGIDYGADPALGPQDFHAYVEVYLGGRWWIFEPSRTAIPTGFVRLGTGRDAADVPFCMIFGLANMTNMQISISAEVGADGEFREPLRTDQALSTDDGL